MKKNWFLIFLCWASFISASQTVNVIWQSIPEVYWELDWIREVLEKLDVNEIIDRKYEVCRDNSIIVSSGGEEFDNYCARLKNRGYNFGVILLSDELYATSKGFYSYCSFVLRNYWDKKFDEQKNYESSFLIHNKKGFFKNHRREKLFPSIPVKSFPLGYKRGFWKGSFSREIKKASDRLYNWSFAGQITKSTRLAMISNMKKIPHYFIHETFSFGGQDSLEVRDYRNLLLETLFVPCPRGWWNLDSFRICEALECGCIPIVEKTPFNYFEKLLGKYPFLAVNSWEEAPDLIQKLLEDPARLEALRSECYEWWLKYKETMKEEVADLVQKSFFSQTD